MGITDHDFIQHALTLANKAALEGEVPVGAVLVKNKNIIGEGWNQPIQHHDPSAHAEMIAMRNAAKTLNNYRLTNCTLYVTLEPCAMCVGAMIHARIERLVFGALDPKAGAVESALSLIHAPHFNHPIVVEHGILARECGDILKNFFASRRNKRAKCDTISASTKN